MSNRSGFFAESTSAAAEGQAAEGPLSGKPGRPDSLELAQMLALASAQKAKPSAAANGGVGASAAGDVAADAAVACPQRLHRKPSDASEELALSLLARELREEAPAATASAAVDGAAVEAATDRAAEAAADAATAADAEANAFLAPSPRPPSFAGPPAGPPLVGAPASSQGGADPPRHAPPHHQPAIHCGFGPNLVAFAAYHYDADGWMFPMQNPADRRRVPWWLSLHEDGSHQCLLCSGAPANDDHLNGRKHKQKKYYLANQSWGQQKHYFGYAADHRDWTIFEWQ